jgi:Flp pilus assembly protein TadB
MIHPVIVCGIGAGLGCIVIRQAVRRKGESFFDARRNFGLQDAVRLLNGKSRLADVDLEVTQRSLTAVTMERLLVALAGLVLPLVMLIVTALGGVRLPGPLMVIMALIGAGVGYQVPRWQLTSRAALARRRFRTSLSAYLDLVSIMLAGGAGIETALFAASGIGDGPAFIRISQALEVSRTSRQSPWDALADLGSSVGIAELPELAATVRLGGEQGARMTASLVAKASSMRSKQLAEVEAQANAATEKMGLPMVMLFIGFLILLGYPAMHLINAGFST